jgi:hypothetical protein
VRSLLCLRPTLRRIGSASLAAAGARRVDGRGKAARMPSLAGGGGCYSTYIARIHTHTLHYIVHIHSHTVHIHSHIVRIHSHIVRIHSHIVRIHSHIVHIHSHTVHIHSHIVHIHSHTVRIHSHIVQVGHHAVRSAGKSHGDSAQLLCTLGPILRDYQVGM